MSDNQQPEQQQPQNVAAADAAAAAGPKPQQKKAGGGGGGGAGKAKAGAASAAAAGALTEPPQFWKSRAAIFDELYAKQLERYEKLKQPIKITLPDGNVKDGESYVTCPIDIAKQLSNSLAEKVVVAKIDGTTLWDLGRPLERSCKLELLDWDEPDARNVFWHSSAHVLGYAMEKVVPGCRLVTGPSLPDGGFFYEGQTDRTIGDGDYAALNAAMADLAKQKQRYLRLELSKEDVINMFGYNSFKTRTLSEKVPEGAMCSVYRCGDLIDPCRGPHVYDTGRIKAAAVTKNSSSYFRGDAANESLQRVYAMSFPKDAQLKDWLKLQEEAAKRDHRVIGKQQELFGFHDVAPGTAFWMPHGMRIYNKLIEFQRAQYRRRGFEEVLTPNLYNAKLWLVSGHWDKYADCMFTLECEKEEYGLKPMNCLAKDMQLLTEQGWLGYDEVKAAHAAGALKVAGYDLDKKTLIYEAPTRFVDNAGAPESGMYEINDDVNMNIRVTGDHELIVCAAPSQARASERKAYKVTVNQLVVDKKWPVPQGTRFSNKNGEGFYSSGKTKITSKDTVQLINHAANIADTKSPWELEDKLPLGLKWEDICPALRKLQAGTGNRRQSSDSNSNDNDDSSSHNNAENKNDIANARDKIFDAFFQLYGFWLAGGSLRVPKKSQGRNYVVFGQRKKSDIVYVRKLLAVIGMTAPATMAPLDKMPECALGSDSDADLASDSDAGDDDAAVADGAFWTEKYRDDIQVTTFTIHCDAWTKFFFAEYAMKYIKNRVAGDQSLPADVLACAQAAWTALGAAAEDKGTSAKWVIFWMFKLRAKWVRPIIAGLNEGDGESTNPDKEASSAIYTSDVHFRDQLSQLMLHAGLITHTTLKCGEGRELTNKHGTLVANKDHWTVRYSTPGNNSGAAAGTIKLSNFKKIDDYNEGTWCVTMPHGNIIVRRKYEVTVTDNNTNVKFSEPVVIGNCPGHCIMFGMRQRSYRELPIRMAEFGVLHRNELSGALSGLTRVRRFQQDDAHIFCRMDQVRDEIDGAIRFLKDTYDVLGFKFHLKLSTRPENALGSKETWDMAEDALRTAMNEFCGIPAKVPLPGGDQTFVFDGSIVSHKQMKRVVEAIAKKGAEAVGGYAGPTFEPWELNEGDGAFYGPKIDIVVEDALRRRHQLATIQLDFQLPERFGLKFTKAGPAPAAAASSSEEKKEEPAKKPEEKPVAATAAAAAAAATEQPNQPHHHHGCTRPCKIKEPMHVDHKLEPNQERPVMIHRAIFGSMERCIAILTEHYAGKWPIWLSPRQVAVVPVAPAYFDYADQVRDQLHRAGLHVEADLSSSTLDKKIRDAEIAQFNFIFVVGQEELDSQSVNVRSRDNARHGKKTVKEALDWVQGLCEQTSSAY